MSIADSQRVRFQPCTFQSFQRGIAKIVEAIRPTLGPFPRLTAVERAQRNGSPELLDDGGLIARRIISLENRDEDMGAMFLRQALWRLREEAGDGTATAAVLFKSIYDEGVKHIVAGGSPMRLQHFLEKGLVVIFDELSRMAAPVAGQDALTKIAASICPDPSLAGLLGEIFDIIGENGHLNVRLGRGKESEREYIEGSYWDEGLLSQQMINDPSRLRAYLENPAVLVTDLEIEEARQLAQIFRIAYEAGHAGLVIIARKLSDQASAFLIYSNRQSDRFRAFAVKTPGLGAENQAATLEDLGLLIGGRPVLTATGDTLEGVQPSDFGQARRAWADASYFGIVGGQGDPHPLRTHMSRLQRALDFEDSPDVRKRLRERLGRLLGGSATLLVGGISETEMKVRKERAEKAAAILRGALREGVLPGGGSALLMCRSSLRGLLAGATDDSERAAYRILLKALERPMHAIIANAGFDANGIVAGMQEGFGFDVRAGKTVDMAQSGILDSAGVLKAAVRSAVKSAGLALTVDVLVHHKKPRTSTEP